MTGNEGKNASASRCYTIGTPSIFFYYSFLSQTSEFSISQYLPLQNEIVIPPELFCYQYLGVFIIVQENEYHE